MENHSAIRSRVWNASPRAKTLWQAIVFINAFGLFFLIFVATVYPGISWVPYARIPLIVSSVSFVLQVLMLIAAFRSFRFGWILGVIYTIAQFFNPNFFAIISGGFLIWGFHHLAKLQTPGPNVPLPPLPTASGPTGPEVTKSIRYFFTPLILTAWVFAVGLITVRIALSKPSADDFGNFGAAIFFHLLVGATFIAAEIIGLSDTTRSAYKKKIITLAIIVTALALVIAL